MSGRAAELEIPIPAMGPGGMLCITRSRYGDYCDFALVGPLDLIAMLPGYAARLSVHRVSGAVEGKTVGYTQLAVGSTNLYLPLDCGQTLADFLGIPLEAKAYTGE